MNQGLMDRPGTAGGHDYDPTPQTNFSASEPEGAEEFASKSISPASLKRSLKRFWDRAVTLPYRRFVDEVLFRRQWERFYMVFGGHLFFQTLRSAVKLDLFSLLERHGSMTQAEIAEHLGIESYPCRVLLLGCTSTGLLRKKGDRYSNSMVARRVLVKESPRKLTAYVELEHQVMYKAMPWMYEALRENRNVGLQEFPGDEPTIYQRLAHNPEVEVIFQEAMHELSVQANPVLARFVDFSGVRHVVDVGGGDGTNLIELIGQWPHLRGTVFDSPTVCEIAGKNLAASPMADQLAAHAGDCFKDPFPHDADCILFAHFFTIWSVEKDQFLLKKAFEALPSGGRVMIFNMMQRDDERGPLTAAIGSPYFLTIAAGQGMLYCRREYEEWMQAAGFEQVTHKTLPLDHGVVTGIKP